MIKEFICPNGRMSVNGVCPIFEGDDGQIKDFNKPKTFDEKYSEIEDIEKDRQKGFFEFDFEKPTESSKKSAKNILADNISYYNSFVEDTLGIPSNVQNALRIGTAAYNVTTGAGLAGVITPFAIPFFAGAALKSNEEKRIENITMQDPQGDVQTFPTGIMNIQPTARDIKMGGGNVSGGHAGGQAAADAAASQASDDAAAGAGGY